MRGREEQRQQRIDALWRARPTERFVRASLWALLLLLLGAWPVAGFEWGELLSPRRLQNLERFVAELRPFPLQGESWSGSVAARWALDLLNRQGWEAARATLAISICASLLAGGVGYGLALAASRSLAVAEPYADDGRPARRWARFAWAAPRFAIRGLLMGLRSLPEYVWAFLLLAILGPSAWPAVLALAIHNAGILGRLGAETFENAERAAPAALRGIGAGRLQIVGLALLPAVFGRLLLYFFYRWETCVREATVLGMLGIVSLGYWIEEARTRGQYDTLFALVLLGVVIVLVGDLVSLAATLRTIPDIAQLVKPCKADILQDLGNKCDPMDELASLLEKAIEPQCPAHTRDGGIIRAGYSEDLDHLRSISTDGKSWIAKFQQQEIEKTGIANLKIGFNKVFGYYIEISRALSEQAPPHYVRKQTIKNAERYITDELKKYEQQVLGAQDKALTLEHKLFEEVRTETTKYIDRLQGLADTIANIDCLSSLGYLARQRRYIRPTIDDSKQLIITEGKHPVLAEAMGPDFVPNDVALGDDSGDLTIITGPNMAGKSTYIRQVAQLVLLAQTGSFIPAQSAHIGLVDRIFTRVGAADELLRGQSTFMVEMTETANIVNNATDRSLVVLDEVGRGTSTYDGLSLAWAITEHIANNIKCRTLFATHYHQLTELAELLVNVKNCNVAVREWSGSVVFLHKILPGGTDKSYGIHVARLAGLPNNITARSAEILKDLESTFTKEAAGDHLAKMKTADDSDTLFVQKHKSVLQKLSSTDPNNLTPIEAINLLNQIKTEMNEE